jgi:hypothetical protein
LLFLLEGVVCDSARCGLKYFLIWPVHDS